MDKSKKALAKEITEKLMDADNLKNMEEMIRNNIIEFELDEVKYRVRKPTIAERKEVRKFRNKKYFEMLNDDSYLFKEQLVEILKKKGKDVTKIVEKMIELQQQIERVELKLAEYGKEKEKDNKIITELKLKIFELMQERNLLSIEKNELLAGNIEDELSEFTTTYYAYLLLEKKDGEKWVKNFDTYEDFTNSKDNKLMAMVGHYLGLLLYQFSEDDG